MGHLEEVKAECAHLVGFFIVDTITDVLDFSPFATSTHSPPPLPWPSPHCCLCPWAMHICSLADLFTFFYPVLPTPLPSEICQSFHVSMPLVLFCSSVGFNAGRWLGCGNLERFTAWLPHIQVLLALLCSDTAHTGRALWTHRFEAAGGRRAFLLQSTWKERQPHSYGCVVWKGNRNSLSLHSWASLCAPKSQNWTLAELFGGNEVTV